MTSPGERTSFWSGLTTAREIAAAAGARTVGTQHVLLAVLRRADPDAVDVLHAAAIDEDTVAATLRGIAGTGCRNRPVPVEWVSVSPRVLALVRAAGRRSAGNTRETGPTDLAVLDALLGGDEPSLAHLVLTGLGAHQRLRFAMRARRARVDDAGGGLVDA